MFKLDLEKVQEPEIKLPPSAGSEKKQGNSKRLPTSGSLSTLKLLTVWITRNCGKFLEMGVPDHLTFLLRNLFAGQEGQDLWQVKKHQLEPDVEQQTGSKLGKENVKAAYRHPAYLTYMQSTSGEVPGWMKHKLGSRLAGEISVTSDMQMTPPLWQKVKRN